MWDNGLLPLVLTSQHLLLQPTLWTDGILPTDTPQPPTCSRSVTPRPANYSMPASLPAHDRTITPTPPSIPLQPQHVPSKPPHKPSRNLHICTSPVALSFLPSDEPGAIVGLTSSHRHHQASTPVCHSNSLPSHPSTHPIPDHPVLQMNM